MTKIFHPNVSKVGEICVDTLKKAWKREYGVGHVLVVSGLAPRVRGTDDKEDSWLYGDSADIRRSSAS